MVQRCLAGNWLFKRVRRIQYHHVLAFILFGVIYCLVQLNAIERLLWSAAMAVSGCIHWIACLLHWLVNKMGWAMMGRWFQILHTRGHLIEGRHLFEEGRLFEEIIMIIVWEIFAPGKYVVPSKALESLADLSICLMSSSTNVGLRTYCMGRNKDHINLYSNSNHCSNIIIMSYFQQKTPTVMSSNEESITS